jgi:hypothetical protein
MPVRLNVAGADAVASRGLTASCGDRVRHGSRGHRGCNAAGDPPSRGGRYPRGEVPHQPRDRRGRDGAVPDLQSASITLPSRHEVSRPRPAPCSVARGGRGAVAHRAEVGEAENPRRGPRRTQPRRGHDLWAILMRQYIPDRMVGSLAFAILAFVMLVTLVMFIIGLPGCNSVLGYNEAPRPDEHHLLLTSSRSSFAQWTPGRSPTHTPTSRRT